MKVLRVLFLVALVAAACGDDDDGGGDADAAADIDAEVPAGPRPSKRSDTGGVAAPSLGVLAVFGGDDGPIVDQIPSPAYRSDTWVFEPGEGWTEVTGTGPSTRGRHAVALDPTGPAMLAFGGRFRTAGTTGPYTLYNDLWSFDFTTRIWSQVSNGDGGPAPRYFAAAAADSAGTFYVYGGGTNTSPTIAQVATDLWMYDGAWSEVTQSGAVPPSRLFAAYTYDSSRNRLVIFGGQVGDFVTPARNDLYAVDLGTGEWTQLHAGGNGAGTPSGRFSAMLTYDSAGDRYLMTGGHADRGVTNDVWAFDPTGGGWSLARGADTFTGGALGCLGNPQEIPANYVDQDLTAPERRSGGVFEIIGNSAWLFGGESDCSDHLDDTWRYDLATDDWSELLPANSGESCLRRNEDCTCLCL